jgi:hypothetical protein
MLPFLIPGGTLLETLQSGGPVPSALGNHWWWKALVMPHQVWMLLYLSVLLLYEMTFYRSTFRKEPGTPSESSRAGC